MLRPKGFTKTLLLAVIAVGLGSSFLYGFNIGSVNAPRNVMGQWIRGIQCQRLNASSGYSLIGDDSFNSSRESYAWCRELTKKERRKIFKSCPELTAIWTAVATIFCVGGFIGSLCSRAMVAKFGRKGTLLINAVPGLIGALLLAFARMANSWEMVIVGRFFAGLNGGVTSAVAPLYITEIPPLRLRGILGGIHQFFIVFAILIAQILGLPQVFGNATGWSYLFGLGAASAAFSLITLPFCPESPKYLCLDKDHNQKAEHALKRLRGSTKYEEEMKEMLEENERIREHPPVDILGIFRDPLLRSIMIVGIIVTSSGQLSGHGTVIYYSTAVFESVGLSGLNAIYATIGMGILYAISTFATASVVERYGRRPLMLLGLGGMCVLTVALTVFTVMFDNQIETVPETKTTVIGDDSIWISYVIIVCIFLHTIIYAVGPGTIPAFLVSEMFTQRPRAAASSIALATNWLSALITVLTFPLLQAAIQGYTFIFYAVLLVLYFVYTYFKLPETKGKTTQQILEELSGRKVEIDPDEEAPSKSTRIEA
ncbi:solute carrier family 2, facilitated glucose transporter member 1-like [Paramacrobiotus metropolitanus]|uniref:solute carrier family 2, facilitated glucose transporter member 1-like n=1 Tax=Paramacrobiotus metropolitanus TaxID=2943436 RepID=UPI00244564C7|nr:solute carrier family 2, facilitated glucose transporter member 1-like [Paramacrobiotus metropolitanus]XP_055355289.1 solute carrier family 2, facilitated glucose transporter member 1-like [Paramacrobiotus metropolitanus]XP_055355298.1 solute carrier family 2, facilitated glucose transporter member 1-like [Paramacrobiotus metropolitanus]XP_055355304.1 solute carrier family 2, facilitated glucose transporter member 1-like [Paramacrobiotus metropolitanus]XP_055355313.1 solute carrier family 2,